MAQSCFVIQSRFVVDSLPAAGMLSTNSNGKRGRQIVVGFVRQKLVLDSLANRHLVELLKEQLNMRPSRRLQNDSRSSVCTR